MSVYTTVVNLNMPEMLQIIFFSFFFKKKKGAGGEKAVCQQALVSATALFLMSQSYF